MTKEELFKSYLDDPLLVEKNYISTDRLTKIKISEPSEIKLLEVIKLAIYGNMDNEPETTTARKISLALNK
jgi:hypothetical protein